MIFCFKLRIARIARIENCGTWNMAAHRDGSPYPLRTYTLPRPWLLCRLKPGQHTLTAQACGVRTLFGRGFSKYDILRLFAWFSAQKAALLTVRTI